MKAKINEVFYSLQMEGENIGYASVFVRFTGCNLSCDFCDTKYALYEGYSINEDELFEKVSRYPVKRVIFTGGEPVLYDEFMAYFMKKHRDYDYFIETNATIFPEYSIKYLTHITASPKFHAINSEVIKRLNTDSEDVEFKFIVKDKKDILKSEGLIEELKLKKSVLQPMYINGENRNDYIKRSVKLIEIFKKSRCAKGNTRFIIQNHKILYGDKPGV